MLAQPCMLASAALASLATAASSQQSHNRLAKRVATDSSFQQTYYQSNYKDGAQAPGFQAGDSDGQTVIINSNNGTDNNSPVSTCPIAYIGGAAVVGSEDDGWESKAQIVGFDTKSLEVDNNITMPYYIERKDYTKAKRIIMVLQGKPRDAWRYPNLMRYTGKCAVSNPDWPTQDEDFIVTAPIIYNTNDLKAGGAAPTDLVWNGGSWASGGITKGPGDATWTTFKAMDSLVDLWFNQTMFPALTSVVIAGHSAGAILAQRYAMLRKSTSGQDENIKWLIADAGSYVWPNDDYPVTNPPATKDCKSDGDACDMVASCNTTKTQWPYGMDVSDPSTMNVYGRDRVVKDKQGVIDTYLARRIQYTIAELDDGQGDTHCEAQFQGDSHRSRGWNLISELRKMGATGLTNTTVPNATHVDEEVFIDPASQHWLFVDGISDARNGTGAGGSKSSKGGKGNDSSSSSSKGSSGAASSQVDLAGKAVAALALAFTAAAVSSVGLL